MNAFECYQNYLALKLHFTDDEYDYHKYHGKVSASVDSFKARKDRFFFEKIAKHNDPFGFLLANIVSNPHTYVRDIAYDETAKTIYNKYLKTKESLSYIFTQDLSKLDKNLKSYFIVESNQHPKIIKLYLSNKISLETLCILADITKCLPYWNKQLKGDVIYRDVGLLVSKYTAFLKYDKEKFTKIIQTKR